MSEDLQRLAAALGIVDSYDDIWGKHHVTSDATRAALVRAMGIALDRPDDARAALRTIERAHWHERIAPMTVVRENTDIVLDVRLPAVLDGERLALRVAPEDGRPEQACAVSARRSASAEVDGEAWVQWQLRTNCALPPGYHRATVLAPEGPVAQGQLAVAPATCYRPHSLSEGRRTWGLALQLYGLRSDRNWGIGDLSDLAAVVRMAGPAGIGTVGVNPLHALFPARPLHCSPYGPSSRRFLNVLYIDVTAVPDFVECREAQAMVEAQEFQRQLAALRAGERVDYEGVARAKLRVLRALHSHFAQQHVRRRTERGRAFEQFVADEGEGLRRYALFDALHECLVAEDASAWGWPAWPAEYRDADAEAVARFEREHADVVDFHAYLQWQARLQLRAAAEFAQAARLSLGLYVDLSVSVDRGGADVWAERSLYAEAAVGAPPDDFNRSGQNWGLPPTIPARLRALAYRPFLEMLRANMRHAGALRLDHVMGLAQLYWIPAGRPAAEGAYVRYPFDDLLGLLALESHRHGCLVIGEDLGTVPADVRTAMAANDILSYRVLLFEREATGEFSPASAYPERSLVTASTHDLPTLAGWWAGRDIDMRRQAGVTATDDERRSQHAERSRDRQRLHRQLCAAAGAAAGQPPAALSPDDALAVQRFLAGTPAALMIVQLEDAFGAIEQANLPGTTDAHPNWQRKLEVPLEAWADDARFSGLVDALRPLRADPRQAGARVPRATYRLQLHGGFTFADATVLVPYLHALGISHVYCSPYLRARAGSQHGYDIVDHGALNPEIGSADDYLRFITALRQHGMGHIADVVPNHMAVMGSDNAWWMDVLAHGQASRYAHYFDIDWKPLDPDLAGRVLLPVLGTPYGEALEGGEIEIRFERECGVLAAWYHGHRFPLDPRSYADALAPAVEEGGLDAPLARRLAQVIETLRAIPPRDRIDLAEARRHGADEVQRHLAELASTQPAADGAIRRALARLVPVALDLEAARGAVERLHTLLEAQAFRLAYWRVAFDEINYRRFFDINDLAALRMEEPEVFEVTHRHLLNLVASGMIDGLRIDHPDGLYDPAAYFAALQAGVRRRAGTAPESDSRAIYVVVEKIIAPHEDLPETWPVHGTTGYRYANAANGLLVDDAARARIDRIWRAFVGDEAENFDTIAYDARRAMVRGPLAAGLTALASEALRIARSDRHTRDHTLASLRQGLEQIAASFPVYRTYVAASGASAQDRRYIDWATGHARRRSRLTDLEVFAFLRALLLAEPREPGIAADRCLAFAMRFQQFTAPLAAKGIEDTAFYRFNRLLSLADVGGDPDHFGTTVRAFHGASGDRAAHWPATMLATSTHDNKRSEDVRARIDVLSERPAGWRLTLRRWSRFNRSHRQTVDDAPAPSRNDELLLYQTLIGTFPSDGVLDDEYRARIRHYMMKAAREAKVHTSWVAVNEDYERAVASFVDAILAPGRSLFLDDLRAQMPLFAWFGLLNSVTLTLLKLTSPGVPDVYQGNELMDFSLVDPDNRRPVDFAHRRHLLRELEMLGNAPSEEIRRQLPALFTSADGRAKLWVVMRLLAFRRYHAGLLAQGDYRPVAVRGARANHVVAYARTLGREGLLVVAGRLFAQLGTAVGALPVDASVWNDTALTVPAPFVGATLTDVLGAARVTVGKELRVVDAWRGFPGAVLYGVAPAP